MGDVAVWGCSGGRGRSRRGWGGWGVDPSGWAVSCLSVAFSKDPPTMLLKLHYCLGVLEHSMPCACPGPVPTSSGNAAWRTRIPTLQCSPLTPSEKLIMQLGLVLALALPDTLSLAFCFIFSVLSCIVVVIIFNAQPKCASEEIFAYL